MVAILEQAFMGSSGWVLSMMASITFLYDQMPNTYHTPDVQLGYSVILPHGFVLMGNSAVDPEQSPHGIDRPCLHAFCVPLHIIISSHTVLVTAVNQCVLRVAEYAEYAEYAFHLEQSLL